MTVTVPKIRSAAVMDVDISVCLHIKVFVILMCGPACFHVCVVVFFFFVFYWSFCHSFSVMFMSAGPAKPGVCPKNNVEVAVLGVCAEMCSHDSDCPKKQKCCSNGCGHQCMPPYKGICFCFFFGPNSVISFSVMCFVCQQNVRETGKFSS